MAPPVIDVTPPDITNIATSNLTASGITVTFTTSEAATGWISYSPGAVCPCTDVYSSATGITHVVTLDRSGTGYALPVRSQGHGR